jgi:signal transduction histidine kinase
MRPAPAWWRAIGGPWCVSIWSGIVGVAFVIPSAIWTAIYSPLSLWESAVGEIAAAAVSLLVLWWAHAWWLSPSRAGQRHRSLLAVATFALVGLVRLAMLYAAREALAIEHPWSPMQALITGGIYSVVMLSLVAVVVDAVRQHACMMEDLEQAQQTLARAAEVEADEVEAMQIAYVERVLGEVRAAVEEMRGSQDPQRLASGIQEASDRLVRAGSHALQAGEVLDEALAVPRPRVGLRRVLAGVGPAAPIAGPVAFEVLVFTAFARDFGTSLAVLNAVLATGVLVAGNLLLGRMARRRWPSRGCLPLLFGAYLAIGLVATLAVQGVLLALGEFRPLWSGGVAFALFMLLVSILPSMRRMQSEAERALADSVAQLTMALGRVRSLAAEQRRQLAHLMHGGLQAELTAAAVAITRSLERGDSADVVDARVAELVSMLEGQVALTAYPTVSQSLDDVVETWSLALDVELSMDDGADALMRQDCDLAGRVVDVVSEGLTNAVRHASVRSVLVAVRGMQPGLIVVDVVNAGRLDRAQHGHGSQLLDERCESWSLTPEGDSVRLSARLTSRSPLRV